MRRLARFIATAGGLGHAPFAPGTVASLAAVVPALWLAELAAENRWAYLAVLALLLSLALWAAGWVAREAACKDPGHIVIDEVVGYFLAVAFLVPEPITLAAAFLAFRFFDILKPWPVASLEALPGGLGVVADDLMAGLYANLTLRLLDFFLIAGLARGIATW